MSADRFKTDLIKLLLAVLEETDPQRMWRILQARGFRAGDVTFRTTNEGQRWTEINRWPWEAAAAPIIKATLSNPKPDGEG